MRYAIVLAGGKQFVAREGETIEVDHLPLEVGQPALFKEVLLLSDDKQVHIGNPLVQGARVEGKVVAQVKGPKILVFKYRAKLRYRRKTGHRQQYTRVAIEDVSLAGEKRVRERVEAERVVKPEAAIARPAGAVVRRPAPGGRKGKPAVPAKAGKPVREGKKPKAAAIDVTRKPKPSARKPKAVTPSRPTKVSSGAKAAVKRAPAKAGKPSRGAAKGKAGKPTPAAKAGKSVTKKAKRPGRR